MTTSWMPFSGHAAHQSNANLFIRGVARRAINLYYPPERECLDNGIPNLYRSRITIETEGPVRKKIAGVLVAAVGLLVYSAPLLAHHGAASFDDKILTFKGTVTEW